MTETETGVFEIPTVELNDNSSLVMIPLDKLVPDAVGIRTEVDKKKPEWPGFVESIRTEGVQQSILVRPHPTEGGKYIIINGFHRYEASREGLAIDNAALKAANKPLKSESDILIPAKVREVTDQLEVLKLQLITNAQTIATRPIQYSEHLQRLMKASNFTVTIQDLADLVKMSPSWVSNMLSLRTLQPDAKKAVAEGKITAANGYWLARLPQEEQEHFIDRAERMSAADFGAAVGTHLAEARKHAKANRPDPNVFVPTAKLRTKAESMRLMEAWYEKHLKDVPEDTVNGVNRNSLEYILGVFDGICMLLSLDKQSVAEQEVAFRADLAERLRKKQEKEVGQDAEVAASKGVGVFNKRVEGAVPIGL